MPVYLHAKTNFPEETYPRVIFAVAELYSQSISAYVVATDNSNLLWMPQAEMTEYLESRGGRIWNVLLVKPRDKKVFGEKWGLRADGKNLRSLTLREVWCPIIRNNGKPIPTNAPLKEKIGRLSSFLLSTWVKHQE